MIKTVWEEDTKGNLKMDPMQNEFTNPASEEVLQQVVTKLRERNIEAVVVDTGEDARKLVLEMLPKGAEVHSGKSKTLQDAGITDLIQDPNEYDALRPRYLKMDRQTQAREIRKLIASPDFMLGSVNAVTEDGVLVETSATGSQFGPYSSSGGKVILVVGSQKIVPDLETALRRIREFVLPWEDAQVRKVLPAGSFVGKILIIEREWVKGRMMVILVRAPIGI
jgi:LUD domain